MLGEAHVVIIRRSATLIGAAALCGIIGFIVPQFFDRDVGGALASTIFGMIGLAIGVAIGAIIVRQNRKARPTCRRWLTRP
jgi:hypothetical protein